MQKQCYKYNGNVKNGSAKNAEKNKIKQKQKQKQNKQTMHSNYSL